MKLHIDDMKGPDVYKAQLCNRAKITLDGNEIKRCIEADEEGGFVVAYIPQDDPRFKAEMIKQGCDCWPVETLRGVVRIIDPEAKT